MIGQYTSDPNKATVALGDDLSFDALREYGFFGEFRKFHSNEDHRIFPQGEAEPYAPLYAPSTDGEGDPNLLAELNRTQWDLLASSIPSLSDAAGANSIEPINEIGQGNFDMQAMRGDEDDFLWPLDSSNKCNRSCSQQIS